MFQSIWSAAQTLLSVTLNREPCVAAIAGVMAFVTLSSVGIADPLRGIPPKVFLHTAADVQPEDLEKKLWEALMKKVQARLEENGLEVQAGDWFAAQRQFEEAKQRGEAATPPGPRVMVALSVLKDPRSRYVYATHFELRELGYFPRPQGDGFTAQEQQLHADLAFFPQGETQAPPGRIAEWKAVQTGDVASFATPGTLGYSTWDNVESGVLSEVERFARAWNKAN